LARGGHLIVASRDCSDMLQFLHAMEGKEPSSIAWRSVVMSDNPCWILRRERAVSRRDTGSASRKPSPTFSSSPEPHERKVHRVLDHSLRGMLRRERLGNVTLRRRAAFAHRDRAADNLAAGNVPPKPRATSEKRFGNTAPPQGRQLATPTSSAGCDVAARDFATRYACCMRSPAFTASPFSLSLSHRANTAIFSRHQLRSPSPASYQIRAASYGLGNQSQHPKPHNTGLSAEFPRLAEPQYGVL